MQELSAQHSCSTCMHSLPPRWSIALGAPHPRLDTPSLSLSAVMRERCELFPLENALNCSLFQDALSENCVQAVLVRCDGFCESYDCHEERFYQVHGLYPEQTELAGSPKHGGKLPRIVNHYKM